MKHQRPLPSIIESFVQRSGKILSGLGLNVKRLYELSYWRWRYFREKELSNSWYQNLFTDIVNVDRETYSEKIVIDIGCGPRGSLEWLDDANIRVGVDPLMADYLKFNVVNHSSCYVASQAENLPFQSSVVDMVTSFNSLDHVDDLMQTLSEVERVLTPGGLFVVMVEIHPKATLSEPITIPWNLTSMLSNGFTVLEERHLEESPSRPGASAAARANITYKHDDARVRSGTLIAILQRR